MENAQSGFFAFENPKNHDFFYEILKFQKLKNNSSLYGGCNVLQKDEKKMKNTRNHEKPSQSVIQTHIGTYNVDLNKKSE